MTSLITMISTTRHFKRELPVGEMIGMAVFAGHTLCATDKGVYHLGPKGWETLKAGDPARDLRPAPDKKPAEKPAEKQVDETEGAQ
jgi:hypothetical protein